MNKLPVTVAAALLACGLGIGAPPASAQTVWVNAGVLACNVDSGWGFIFGSTRNLNCNYSKPGYTEHYIGRISKFGVDIGFLQGGVIVWNVISPTANLYPGTLAGDYAGVTGGATVGIGAGANVLVGAGHSLMLQPVSIEGNTGLNVAAGIAAINLRYQPPYRVSSRAK